MTDLLPAWPSFFAFVAASLVLAITPGPGVIYIVTRTLGQGRRSGLASVLGVALGNLTNAVAAAVGLAAWFAVSTLAFSVVKYAGAAYLIYLGLRTLLARPKREEATAIAPRSDRTVFRDAFFVALLNPKTTLFYAAFLPQFSGPETMTAQRGVALGAIFVLIAAVTDTIYAFSAGAVAPRLRGARGIKAAGRWFTGGLYLALGIYAAATGSRKSR